MRRSPFVPRAATYMIVIRHEAQAHISATWTLDYQTGYVGQLRRTDLSVRKHSARRCDIETTILRPIAIVKSHGGIFLRRVGSSCVLKVRFLIEPQVKIRYFPIVIPAVAGVQEE